MTQSMTLISPGLKRVAKQAKEHPDRVFTALAHHIDLDLLRAAHSRTRKDGAVGVDGVTAAEYDGDLEGNLRSLLDRAKSGLYQAPPVRRTYIPKADGRRRPLGIPTFEDKVLQRAVVTVLETIYEQDFLDCSYGFRPGRSGHQALAALRSFSMKVGGGWVIDADIRDCFGSLSHSHLRELLALRIRDGVLTRLIGKWLKAGVLEDGSVTRPKSGSPQGGVISPLLANVFMHNVLDTWFETQVKPRLRGRALLVRYADDFVIVCERRDDAERVYAVLPDRLAQYGLELHPDKTRLLPFQRPGAGKETRSFNFLGFTHLWSRSLRGYWIVKQLTAADRMRRSTRRVHEWCRAHRHLPIDVQHRRLSQMILGHCAYFGITGNSRRLSIFRHRVERTWRYWLCRRSNAARKTWDWWHKFQRRWPLPQTRAIHSILRHS